MFPLRDENPHPPGFKPILTIILISINVAIFAYEVSFTHQIWEFQNERAAELFYEWGSVPACVTGANSITQNGIQVSCPDIPFASLLSSMFLHGGLMHLGGNMLFLWIFGDNIELKFGRTKYLGLYLFWGIVAGLAHTAIAPLSDIPAVGASGAISGVLGAYLVLFPRAKISTFVMMGFFMRMTHIEARWYLVIWFVFQNILPIIVNASTQYVGGGVAFMAHIGGFVAGLVTGYLYKKTHSSEFTYGTRYGYKA